MEENNICEHKWSDNGNHRCREYKGHPYYHQCFMCSAQDPVQPEGEKSMAYLDPEIEKRFSRKREVNTRMVTALHQQFLEFAAYLYAQLPDGRHKSMALTSLEEALWASVAAYEQDMMH